MKIFVASLYSSLVQCSTSNRDAILNDVQDDKTFLLTSDLCFQDDFSSQTYFGLSYTILISSSYTIPIITLLTILGLVNLLGLGHRPNSYSFDSTFWLTGPHTCNSLYQQYKLSIVLMLIGNIYIYIYYNK